jgi:Uma2 family endonuclease
MGAAKKKLPEVVPEPMTVEEFLAWPGGGLGTRYDLVDGYPRAHAAPSDEHGTIQLRVGGMIMNHLDKTRPECRVVVGSGVRPKFRAQWNFRQPDVSVTCKPNVKGAHEIPDPSVIVEVLSPSNRRETWDNIRNFMTLPSVLEIAIVHSTRVYAELLVRNEDGTWPADPVGFKADATLRLHSIDFESPVTAFYRGTYLIA